MKKLLKIFAALLVLVVAALFIVPSLIPAETYKAEITRQVQERTGRTLNIAGDVHASVYPSLGVKLGKVTLSNPVGYSAPSMVELQEMTVQVALMPLLHGQVEVKRFVLDKPVIRLEVNAKGEPNWQFQPLAAKNSTEKPAPAQAPAAEAPAEKSDDPVAALERLTLGEVKISDGTIAYADQRSKAHQTADHVNLEIGLKHLDEPFTLKGDAVWNSEKISLDTEIKTLKTFLSGKDAALQTKLESKHVTLDLNGTVSEKKLAGKLALSSPSLVQLAKWTGSAFDWKGQGPLAFGTKGNLDCGSTQCTLANAEITLDALKANGALGATFGGAVPQIKTQLTTELLDVNPFMPAAPAQHSWLSSPAYADEGWSTDKIDLSGLKAVNADISITANAIRFQQLNIGKTQLTVLLNNGVLKLAVPQIALYGGAGKAELTADTANKITAQLSASGLQAEPFLKDMTGDDRLSGTMAMQMSLNMQGASQQQLIRALAGSGNMRFTDGALKGINIAEMVRNPKSIVVQSQNEAQKTDFAELGGSYTIASGIVNNQDLAMKAPLFRLTGKGTVDLPQKTVNYRLLAGLTGSLKGQGGKDNEGLSVPILVQGPLSKPTYRPDLAGMATEIINDPSKAKESLKDAKSQLKDVRADFKEKGGVKGLLKGLGR